MVNNIKGLTPTTEKLNGEKLKIGVVTTRWNIEIIESLKSAVQAELKNLNVPAENIVYIQVPGAFELPMAAKILINSSKYEVDAVICIGCLIKGSTVHFEYIAESVCHGLQKVALESNIPVIFGVLTCLTEEQAKERSGLTEGGHNHGIDWATGAVEMALLKQRLK